MRIKGPVHTNSREAGQGTERTETGIHDQIYIFVSFPFEVFPTMAKYFLITLDYFSIER